MFENLDVFRMSAAMARHAGHRQAVIAQNVANADTPGYVARDIPAFATSYAPDDSGAHQRATRAGHMHGMVPGQAPPIMEMPGEGSPNGNQVTVEEEIFKAVEAKRQHDRAIAIYKSALTVMRNAIRTQ
ncbi:MAG: FlgB family protein [Pseudomonadota bacterium]